MRSLILAVALVVSGSAFAQSVHFRLTEERIPYTVQSSGFAPQSTVQGLTVIRSQQDFNAFWAANNGMAGLRNAVAPWQITFEDSQLIGIVIPARFGFDAIPTVRCVETSGRNGWRIEIVPTAGSVRKGSGAMVPYVLVRTPKGSNCLEVVLHDPDLRPICTFRTG